MELEDPDAAQPFEEGASIYPRLGDQVDLALQLGALKLADNCYDSYRKASPEIGKQYHLAFFSRILLGSEGEKVTFEYAEPFASLFQTRDLGWRWADEVGKHTYQRLLRLR